MNRGRFPRLSDLAPTSRLLFHYTKASTALEHILLYMRLRLGGMADTNDPWECAGPRSASWNTVWENHEEMNRAFRSLMSGVRNVLNQARVACLCRDDDDAMALEQGYAMEQGSSACGWARDRMWAQYADNHRGVCLVFDRDALVRNCREALGSRGECLSGEVHYSDEHPEMPIIDMDAASCAGFERYAALYREANVHARYFTKRVDWQHEREYRLVLLDNEPADSEAFVDIKGALVAVLVGHRFSDGYRACIMQICEAVHIPAFHFWYKGRRPCGVPYEVGLLPAGP